MACQREYSRAAVAAGAIGAHVLKGSLTPQQLDTFRLADYYQLVHAIGLILVGVMGTSYCSRPRLPDSNSVKE